MSGNSRTGWWRGRASAAVLALFAVIALAACGGGTPGTAANGAEGAQPVRNGGFAPGAFVNLPKPGGAQPFGPPTEEDGTWVQSFEVSGLSSAGTVQLYDSALGSGWTEVTPPAPMGDCASTSGTIGNGCTYRAVWSNDPQQLEITAGPDGTNRGNSSDGTELSLLLTNAG